jgi:hypothetical protein
VTYLITDTHTIGNTSLSGLLGKEQQMAWFKVDDGFYSSMKFLTIPREYQSQAAGLWLLAGTWSADKMTDGFVPYQVLDQWIFDSEVINYLIGVGLWIHNEERYGIQFHDWCDYQPTREALEAKSVARSEKNKQNVAKRWNKESTDTNAIRTVYETDTNALPKDTPEPEPEPFTSKEVNALSDFEIRVFDECFEEFWSWYPRKTGKGAARKAYAKALKKKNHIALCHAANRLASDPNLPEKQFIPHPATWLNEERWDDEPYAPRGKTNLKQIQQREASEKFLASFTEQPAITANPEWA